MAYGGKVILYSGSSRRQLTCLLSVAPPFYNDQPSWDLQNREFGSPPSRYCLKGESALEASKTAILHFINR